MCIPSHSLTAPSTLHLYIRYFLPQFWNILNSTLVSVYLWSCTRIHVHENYAFHFRPCSLKLFSKKTILFSQHIQQPLTMDPEYSAQDLTRCDLFEFHIPPEHCDICHINLCVACVEEHLSDESKEHYIVPIRMQGVTFACLKHPTKHCTLHCKQCGTPICPLCVSSGVHYLHDIGMIGSQQFYLEHCSSLNVEKHDISETQQFYIEYSSYPTLEKHQSLLLSYIHYYSLNRQNKTLSKTNVNNNLEYFVTNTESKRKIC